MKISVIIPSYKPQDYIYKCLDSLAQQTLSKELWEVIIVLNGCFEPWYSMLKDYIQSHHLPNARLIQSDEGGVSNARNIGIDKAMGEYLTFIDDDDYVSEAYLEKLLQVATPDTIALSNTIKWNKYNRHLPYAIEQDYLKYAGQGKIRFDLPRKYFSGPCMKLIHRDIIGERRFNTHFKNGEDSLFMFEISDRMQYVAFTDKDAIYFRYVREGSISHITLIETIKCSLKSVRAYCKIYFHGKNYSFIMFVTRILASFHAIIDIPIIWIRHK